MKGVVVRQRKNVKADVCFCDACSKVCDSSARAEAFHDARMLSAAQMRGRYTRGL